MARAQDPEGYIPLSIPGYMMCRYQQGELDLLQLCKPAEMDDNYLEYEEDDSQ